jgi:hypothetical protein
VEAPLLERANTPMFAGGIVATAVGGSSMLVGLALLTIAGAFGGNVDGSVMAGSMTALLLGGGVLAGGIVMIKVGGRKVPAGQVSWGWKPAGTAAFVTLGPTGLAGKF